MNLLIVLTFISFISLTLIRLFFLLKDGFNPRGIIPINKALFISSKISVLLTYTAPLIYILFFKLDSNSLYLLFGTSLYTCGSLIALISFYNLNSTALKFGIPETKTELETKGLYSISRNPMYLSFLVMLFGSCIITLNLFLFILTIFITLVHHSIIKKEEQFLFETFKDEWLRYTAKVRRYI